MLRNIFYAILLGVGMAACLSQSDNNPDDASITTESDAPIVSDATLPPAPSAEQLKIEPGLVGFVRINDNIETMRETIPAGFTIKDTTLLQEGMQATAYIISPAQQSKGFIVEQQCSPACKVWRINVQSVAYTTPKAIGVGAAYSAVNQTHPISTVTLADGGLVAVAKEGGLSFVLDATQIPEKLRSRLTPETVPANTLVKSILVY